MSVKLEQKPCKLIRQNRENVICAQLASISVPDFAVIKGIESSILTPAAQQCVPDGFHTSVVPTQSTLQTVPALLWGKTCWCSPIESMLLLSATRNNPP